MDSTVRPRQAADAKITLIARRHALIDRAGHALIDRAGTATAARFGGRAASMSIYAPLIRSHAKHATMP